MTIARPDEDGPGPRERRVWLGLAAALLVTWSLVIPMFEAPDEFLHWQYARHLHDTWRLPIFGPAFAEGNSPPLYYAVIAPVATRTATPPPLIWINGLDNMAIPFSPVHYLSAADDLQRYWPIRAARLLSVLMSLGTIAACFRAGLVATGRASTGLLAAGLAAGLPQFAFRGSHVSNDVLMTTMSACTVLLMVVIVRRGFTWGRGLLAAVALAAAYLCKINAIALAPPLALVLLTEPSPWRERLKSLSVFAVALLLVAPWSIRNIQLYGDPFASGAMHAAVSTMVHKRSLWELHYFLIEMPREAFKSFVGYFGYVTVRLSKPVYFLYLAFFLFGVAGLVRRCLRDPDRTQRRLVLVLAAVLACSVAVLVHINRSFDQPQGRYLFPALPAVMLAVAMGLEGWKPWAAARAWAARATVAGWAAANLIILTTVIVPTYYPPLLPSISEARLLVPLSPARDVTAAASSEPGAFVINGDAPELAASVHVAAADARFVLFDLEGRLPAGTATGSIVFTLDDPAREVRVPFEWRADGRLRTIYLTTIGQPGWQGTVTRVSVRPIESGGGAGAGAGAGADGGGALRGLPVTVRNVRLLGSVPSHDF
jgi:4-amino-4-deoxy-L-arabinose transferase-like glycosyltransferase